MAQSSWKDELARLVPMAACAVLLGIAVEMIVTVRPVPPADMPYPDVDLAALASVAEADAKAYDLHRIKGEPFGYEIRAIGQALDCWNGMLAGVTLPMNDCPGFPGVESLRKGIQIALGKAYEKLGFDATMSQLQELRAERTEAFMVALARVRDDETYRGTDEMRRETEGSFDAIVAERWISIYGTPHVPLPIIRARYRLLFARTLFDLQVDCDVQHPSVCYGLTTGAPSQRSLLPPPQAELAAFLRWLVIHPVVSPKEGEDPNVSADTRRLTYVNRLLALDAWIAEKARESGDSANLNAHPYAGNWNATLARGALLFHLKDYEGAAQSFACADPNTPKNSSVKNWCAATYDGMQNGAQDDD